MKNKILLLLMLGASAQQMNTEFKLQDAAVPVVAALVGGIAKQFYDNQQGGDQRTFNPLILESRDASADGQHGNSVAGGLQAAGLSGHLKIPTTLDFAAAWESFKPVAEVGIDNKHDKAVELEKRTDKNVQKIAYAKIALGPDLKAEVRTNVSNTAVAAFMAAVGAAAAKWGPGALQALIDAWK